MNQAGLLNQTTHIGQKLFKYKLISISGGGADTWLEHAPKGWDSGEFQMSRNDEYHGVFFKYSPETLSFPKEGRAYLRDAYLTKGINADIQLEIHILNRNNFDYVKIFTGKIDFTTYEIDMNYVTVKVIDTSFTQKFLNRAGNEVSILPKDFKDTETIGGHVLPYPGYSKGLHIPAITEMISATAEIPETDHLPVLDDYHLPVTFIESGFIETKNVDTDSNLPFFEDSTVARDVRVKGSFIVTMKGTGSSMGDPDIRFYLNNSTIIGTVTGTGTTTKTITFDETVTLAQGDDIEIYYTPYLSVQSVKYESGDMYITSVVSSLSAIGIPAVPVYEAFLALTQKIQDLDTPFYSEFFGRDGSEPLAALPLNQSELYSTTNNRHQAAIVKGRHIRFSLRSDKSPFVVTFEDLFKSFSAIFNLGAGIETIEGLQRIRVEEKQFFYDDQVALDLSDRINSDEFKLTIRVEPGMYYSEIKAGYEKSLDNELSRYTEFNTKAIYSSPVFQVKNELDLVSPYRADTTGIINLLEKYGVDEDVAGDDDNFIIHATFDQNEVTGTGNYQALQNEDFPTILNSKFGNTGLNHALTPARNLLRHGYVLKSGLKHFASNKLKYQNVESENDNNENKSNTTLLETTDINGLTVNEGEDIPVYDLDEPIWRNEIYEIVVPFYLTDLLTLQEKFSSGKPKGYGLVKLTGDRQGWIKDIKVNLKENKAEISLLPKYSEKISRRTFV